MSLDRSRRVDRGYAIAAGIFFIIATFLLFVGEAFYKPVIEAVDVLEQASPQRGTIVAGILIQLLCVFAIPMVAVAFYPVLRRFGVGMAMAYVVFRTLEAAFFGIKEMNVLAMIDVSRLYLAADAAGQPGHAAVGAFVASQVDFAAVSTLVYLTAFVLGTVVINWQMYVTRLVPRFISLSGLISIALLAVASVVNAVSAEPPAWAFLLLLPIAVQEMVFALWLIIKGFDSHALARASR